MHEVRYPGLISFVQAYNDKSSFPSPGCPAEPLGSLSTVGAVSANQDSTAAPLWLRSLNKAFSPRRKAMSVSDLDCFEF